MMDKPNIIEMQNIADYTIKEIAVQIETTYNEKSISQYLEKYKCDDVKELVYILLCEFKPNDLTINMNMRQVNKDISNEKIQVDTATQFTYSQVFKLIDERDYFFNEWELSKNSILPLKQKLEKILSDSDKVKAILNNNGLDLRTELAKLKNKSTYQSTNLGI